MPSAKDPRLIALQNNPAAYQNMWDQIAQVEGMYNQRLSEGMSKEEALTKKYTGDEMRQRKYGIAPGSFGGNNQYVVKDGDTLGTIASQTGSNPADILNNNPSMQTPKPGMVLSTPPAGSLYQQSEKEGADVAAYGSLTTNPGGMNRYASATDAQLKAWGQSGLTAQKAVQEGTAITSFAKPASIYEERAVDPWGRPVNANAASVSQFNAGSLTPQGNTPIGTPANKPAAQPAQTPSYSDALTIARNNLANKPNSIGARAHRERTFTDELQIRVALGYTPTMQEVQRLVDTGRISKVSPQANGGLYGNYSYGSFTNRYNRYSRGGGYGGYSSNNRRPPAFSSGAGFSGLVNWRI